MKSYFKSPKVVALLSFLLLGVGIVLSLFTGAVQEMDSKVFWVLRFPRTLCAIAVGGGLAIAGALAQAVLNNSLADPFTIGVASAAALGVVVGSVLPIHLFDFYHLTSGVFAFIFSIASLSGLLFWLRKGFRSSTEVLLVGVIAGLFFNALATLITALADPASWSTNLAWMLGSLSNLSASEAFVLLCINLILSAITWMHWKPLDLIAIDETSAESAGVDVGRFRKRFFILLALLTAVCVSSSGIIGFLGLIVPHFLRKLGIIAHRHLLPLCFISGAGFLLCSDVLARVVVRPSEIPVGVVMALIGAPFFLMLKRQG